MNHVIVVFICLVIPIISYFSLKSFKQKPIFKEKAYLSIYVIYGMILIYCIWQQIADINLFHTDAQISNWYWIPAAAIALYRLLDIFSSVYGPIYHEKYKEMAHKTFEEKAYIHPTSRLQVVMFLGVAIIVGIVEEVFYRSFLFSYFQNTLGLSMLLSGLLLTVVFGLGHFPQGRAGIVSSTINGAMYWLLFILTQSLLLPIVLHILYDARIALTSYIVLRQKETRLV